MERISKTLPAVFTLCLFLLPDAASAASLDVPLGQTAVVSTGQVYDSAVVRNGGVLILDGGAIGTNTSPSVTVEAGGRFVFNSGTIRYFDNRGVTEFYGGSQSAYSSENRGYLKLAGGDPGIQIMHYDGTLDVYYTATHRTSWEIDSSATSAVPEIRFFSISNSLAPGFYTYDTLTPATYYPFGKVYQDSAIFWTPAGSQIVAQVDMSLSSNWSGRVWSYPYSAPASPTASVRTAVEVSWNAVSGRTYQVQSTTNLVSGVWRNFGLPVPTQAATGSVLDATTDTNKSYRVLLRH